MASAVSTSEPNDPELAQTAWDLEPLVDGEGEGGVERRMQDALTRARTFARALRRQRVGELDGAGLGEAMTELAEIYELVGRAGNYAALRFSTDTADAGERRAAAEGAGAGDADRNDAAVLRARVGRAERGARRGAAGRRGPGFLRATTCATSRRYREHLLSEPEEKILAEKALTGASAWSRLFEELTSAIEVELPEGAGAAGRPALDVALDVALEPTDGPIAMSVAAPPRRSRAALAPGLRTRAFLFNTLLADKATDDRLRRYPHWLAARNLANEASDESVRR